MVSRRVCLVVFLAMFAVPTRVMTQLKPFRLRLARNGGLPETLSLNDCIPGTLYLVEEFTRSDSGQKLADTLELSYRSNQNVISAIPTGLYTGRVRTDGAQGWRIEFDAVPGRSNIQIHPGNRTSEIEGCVLVGKSANMQACTVLESKATRDQIQALYGGSTSHPIEVKVE
jgi:hypothetical protein